jgi:hypothetical protein
MFEKYLDLNIMNIMEKKLLLKEKEQVLELH